MTETCKRDAKVAVLIKKYTDAYSALDYSAQVFRGKDPEMAARLSAEAVLDHIVEDLHSLIPEAQEPTNDR